MFAKRLTAGNLVLAFGMRSLDNECSPYGVPSAAAPLFLQGFVLTADTVFGKVPRYHILSVAKALELPVCFTEYCN